MRIHAALLVGLYIYRSLSTVHHDHADAMLMLMPVLMRDIAAHQLPRHVGVGTSAA